MFSTKKVLALALCLFFMGTITTSCSQKKASNHGGSHSGMEADHDFPIMRYKELKENLESGESITIIDVNSPETFAKGHLPNAFNFAQNKDNLEAKLPAEKDTNIVVYCGGPMCGAWKQAALALQELGYTNVSHYPGGLQGWQKKGEKLAS